MTGKHEARKPNTVYSLVKDKTTKSIFSQGTATQGNSSCNKLNTTTTPLHLGKNALKDFSGNCQ